MHRYKIPKNAIIAFYQSLGFDCAYSGKKKTFFVQKQNKINKAFLHDIINDKGFNLAVRLMYLMKNVDGFFIVKT